MRGLAGITARQAGTAGAEAVNATKKKGTEYTEYHWARACGWARTKKPSKLSKIYGDYEVTKDHEIHKAHISKRLLKWAKKHGVVGELQQALDLAKANVEALVGIHPNPGGGVAIHQSAEKGVSILMVRPRTAAQREEQKNRETAKRKRTEVTEEEAFNEENVGPRSPARNYYELVIDVTTFAGIVADDG